MTSGPTLDEVDGVHLAWVRSDDLPEGTDWLTPSERGVLQGLRIEKRRADWMLGRWAAKAAVRAVVGTDVGDVEIVAGLDGRPLARFAGTVPPEGAVSVSISHAGGVGFAAARTGVENLGCDVEIVAVRSDAFVADYFTAAEREMVAASPAGDRDWLTNLVWSAKEAALKALGEGLRLDTRVVEVTTPVAGLRNRPGGRWQHLLVAGPDGSTFGGRWRLQDGLVWTVLREVD